MPFDARSVVCRSVAACSVAGIALAALLVAGAHAPTSAATADEAALASLANDARIAVGLPPLAVSPALSETARDHSAAMASAGTLFHSVGLASAVGDSVPGWTSVAENVAVAGSVEEAHQALMRSSEHRAHILGDFTLLGVGIVEGGDGRLWVTEHFAKAPTIVATTTTSTTTTSTTTAVRAGTVEPASAPAPEPAPKEDKASRAARRPAPASPMGGRPAPVAHDASCLPPPAQDHGQGRAYGRCEDGPAAPLRASDGQGRSRR
jgi:hypothetical protein